MSAQAARSVADIFAMNLVAELDRHCERGLDRINAFVRFNRQVEGWFKGELLMIAADMVRNGLVADFTPDCRMGSASKVNIDLRFMLTNGRAVWIELKHWYIGRYPSGGVWNATTYCTQTTSAAPSNFLAKLPAEWPDPTYLLAVATPKPNEADWQMGVQRLKARQPHRRFGALTKPSDFPSEYFLALLRV